jgi:hypothetical protein
MELPPIPKVTRTLLFVAVAADLVAVVARILSSSYYGFSALDFIVFGVLALVTGVLALIAAVQARQRVPLAVSVTLAVFATLLFIRAWLDELYDISYTIYHFEYVITDGVPYDYGWLAFQVGTAVTFGTVVAAPAEPHEIPAAEGLATRAGRTALPGPL